MLPGEWLLPDIPPMEMDDASERFDGNMLSLVTEQNFERMFQCFSTICLSARIFGWYPDCRFTGFFEESGSKPLPSLEIVMVEFMRPNPYQAEDCSAFLQREMQDLTI